MPVIRTSALQVPSWIALFDVCVFFCKWRLADVSQYRSLELSLCMPRRHGAGVEVEIHSFLKKASMEVRDQLHVAAPLFVEQEADPRIGPDVLWEREFSLASIGNRNTNPQA
jgi:hypothetical protein